MHTQTKTWISLILVIAGAVFLFLGARDFLVSHLGQVEARRDFERSEEQGLAVATAVPQQSLAQQKVSKESGRREEHAVALGGSFARLTIPRLNANVYVVEGDTPEQLRKGPGHLSNTVDPGVKGNCVIAGHRDTHFRVLKDIRRGDDIVIETPEGQYLYRVRTTSVVSPENTASLRPTSNAVLHLITCYPFYYIGSAPKRFVVEARLVGAVGRTS